MDLAACCGQLLPMMCAALSSVMQATGTPVRPIMANPFLVSLLDPFLYSVRLEAPLLVFPEAFMRLLGGIPMVPRPLKAFDADRIKKLLALGQLLLESHQTESSARSVTYLLKLCAEPVNDPVPFLTWVSTPTPCEFDELINEEVGSRRLWQLVPQMRFQAKIHKPQR